MGKLSGNPQLFGNKTGATLSVSGMTIAVRPWCITTVFAIDQTDGIATTLSTKACKFVVCSTVPKYENKAGIHATIDRSSSAVTPKLAAYCLLLSHRAGSKGLKSKLKSKLVIFCSRVSAAHRQVAS